MKEKFKKDENYWVREIQVAKAWRKKYTMEDRWPTLDQHYRHAYENPALPHFNLMYMLGNTLVPSLVFQRPGVLNSPTRPDVGAWAQFYDSVDTHLIEAMEITDLMERTVLNCFLRNTTAIGIGFDNASTELAEVKERIGNEDAEDLFVGTKGVTNRTRKSNLPWLDLIPSHRFLVAKGTKTMIDCRWAAKLIIIPTRLVKGTKGLINTIDSRIPQFIAKQENNLWNLGEQGGEVGYCAYWEIHDMEEGTWLWLSTEGKFILKPQPDPLQVFGLPFSVINFNQNTDSIWGTSDAMYIESQQLEGNEMRQFGRLQRKLALLKFLYNSECITQEQLEEWLAGPPGVGLPVKLSGDKTMKDIIVPLQTHINIEYFEAQKQILNDAQLVTGNGPNQFGTFAPGRRTATETNVVEQNNSLRTSRRRVKIAEGIEEILFRANILVSRNWTTEHVQQVVGLDGALYWVQAKPNEFKKLEDGLRTRVNVESLAPVSRERKKAEAMELLKILGGYTQAGVNPLPIIQQLLSAFEWIDVQQVLPQMQNVYNMAAFNESQQKQLTSGVGPTAAQNLGGVPMLSAKYASEGEQNNGNNEEG